MKIELIAFLKNIYKGCSHSKPARSLHYLLFPLKPILKETFKLLLFV